MVTKLVQEMFTFRTKSVGLLLSNSFSSSEPKLVCTRFHFHYYTFLGGILGQSSFSRD